MYDRILIPVDGSDNARRAARRGLEFARAVDAAVDVLHVVERKALRLARTADERERLRESGEATLEEIEAIAAEVGQPVETALLEGKPTVRIAERAAERGAELIVVGRRGRTGLGARLLGGVTESLLHRGGVAVLVVPAGDRTTGEATDYDRVLLPTDGSENARAATDHAVAVARRYGSTVHVLHVVDVQAAGGMFDAGGLEREFLDRLETRGRVVVDEVEAEIAEAAPDVAVTTAVSRSPSFEGIGAGVREYVADAGIDLVVMGSHGRSNLGRRLLGSVASTVVRTVDVPVLVVPRES